MIKLEWERKATLILGLLTIVSAIFVGSFIDGYVTTKLLFPNGIWNLRPWWWINGLILLNICGLAAIASILSDHTKQAEEDYVGALLIFGSSLIIVWSGLADIISACWQTLFWTGNFFAGFFSWFWQGDNGFGWWWCDWTLAGWLSKLAGYAHTQFPFMILSSIIGILILVGLWLIYLFKVKDVTK
jgi:hypothetical protein